jgi:membrane protease YdiL (CAAX protease family)
MKSQTKSEAPKVGPWGPFATVAFTILVAGSFILVQTVLAIGYLMFKVAGQSGRGLEAAVAALETDGLFFSLAEVVAAPTAIGFTVLFAWMRKGPSIGEYLALRLVPTGAILRWLLYTVLIAVLLDGLSYVTGHAVVPDWMVAIYRSAGYLPLFFFSILVVAPVGEELVFRGFFLEGLRHSRLGNTGAVLIAALVWASVHLQYELFYIGQVFVLGLLLGVARVRARSVVPPILMHALFSAIAVLQVVLEVG